MYLNTIDFDLIDSQTKVREINDPKILFEVWERLSYAYLRREISSYMLDEMRTAIWKQFRLFRSREKEMQNKSKSKLELV